MSDEGISEIGQIRKRDGRLEAFQPAKITHAIQKAFTATETPDGEIAQRLSEQAVERIRQHWAGRTPGVEDVQNLVEEVLMAAGFPAVARAYNCISSAIMSLPCAALARWQRYARS